MPKTKVLIIDDDESIRWVLETALKQHDYQVHSLKNTLLAEEIIAKEKPQVVLCDIRMPGEDGFSFTRRITKNYPKLPILLMTAHADLEAAVNAYDVGVFEYIPKPFDLEEIVSLVARAAASSIEPQVESTLNHNNDNPLIGSSVVMQEVFRAIGRLSRSEITVLILGESGTGKELVAKALHMNSVRKDREFVALNMAAIPNELIESELFGHEKGAFTGANERQIGRFEQAHGGTLFLDEIGDMPMSAQTRLLRVLAEGVFHRVGGRQSIHTDVRIVAATHRDLHQMVAQHLFREDLLYRLNVVSIKLPPLRERLKDIPLLANHFLSKLAKEMVMTAKQLKPELVSYLQQYPWAGNVRQLENLCRWFTVMSSANQLGVDDLPRDFKQNIMVEASWLKNLKSWLQQNLELENFETIQGAQQQFERTLLREVSLHFNGHKQKTAKCLNWGRNTVSRKLKDL